MTPVPYIFFDGDCARAMAAYADILHTDPPEILRLSDMPEEARAEMKGIPADPVMHAALKVGQGWIYASDDPSPDARAMAGCNIHVEFESVDAARTAFDRLAEGGETRMDFAPTFWAAGFGTCTDRWGTRWMISAHAAGG